MIAAIAGNCVEFEDGIATIATEGGVSYFVRCNDSAIDKYEHSSVVRANLYVHMHCPQDEAPQLYGFKTKPERAIFKRLIAIQGIGPIVAMRIIGNNGVTTDGVVVKSTLLAVRGVGEKIAQRICEVMG